jgi:hypothetical protein
MVRGAPVVIVVIGCTSPDEQTRCELPTSTIIDPATGDCVPTGVDSCGVIWNTPRPDWPFCGGACAGNDQTTCNNSPSCHPAVVEDQFDSCWDVPRRAPSGRLPASRPTSAPVDDCASIFRIELTPESQLSYVFDHCDAEP